MITEQEANGEDLPPRLRQELAQLYRAPLTIGASVDQQILSRAKASHALKLRRRPIVRWAATAAAIAAVLAICWAGHLALTRHPARFVKGDINGDGRVNMVDAYVLAGHVASGKHQPAWDVNGDGLVDQKDVDWIANIAVRVQASADVAGGTP